MRRRILALRFCFEPVICSRFAAFASEDDRPRARQLIRYHDEVWEFGRTNPNLRALGI